MNKKEMIEKMRTLGININPIDRPYISIGNINDGEIRIIYDGHFDIDIERFNYIVGEMK